MPNHEKKPEAEAQEQDEAETNAELDFEELDLTVERVEERISPSETNVFDK